MTVFGIDPSSRDRALAALRFAAPLGYHAISYKTPMRLALPRTEQVETTVAAIADACLGYLAENPDELLAFMQFAGLDPAALRGAVGSPALQHGLIDYVAANEPILLALCANSGLSPERFMRVWHRLNPAG